MSEVRIAAEPRTEFGKGAARRTRRSGRVPAVLYGHGAAPRHISLPGRELMLALRASNVLFHLDVDGKTELALPKDVQRHPVRGHLEHVDLIVVRRGEKVTVEVPLHVTGDIAPGGLMTHDLTTLSVAADATRIPANIKVNVEGMEAGTGIKARDISLPSGVTLVTEPDHTVLHVVTAPTAAQLEGEIEGVPAEAEAAEGVAAGEAAPEGEQPTPPPAGPEGAPTTKGS